MKEPERLFASDPDLARIHAMLDRDAPPDGAVERAAKRIVAAEVAFAGASLAAGAKRVGPSSKLWIVVGLGALAVIGAGVSTTVRALRVAAPHAAESSLPAPPATQRAVEEPVAPAQTIRVEDLPAAPPPSAASSKAPSGDPFLEELALVERARSTLAKGNARECLDAATGYEKRFAKNGLFAEEVEVMRIEALAMSGDRAQARARGVRFLKDHRETPYAERVGRVLEQAAE